MGTRAKWGLAGIVLIILGANSDTPLFMIIGFISILAAIFCDQDSLNFQDQRCAKRRCSPGSYQVRLVSAGDKRINVIKVLRQLTDLGLKEAKDLVDSAPVDILSGVSEEDAIAMKHDLEMEGAVVVVASGVGKVVPENEQLTQPALAQQPSIFEQPGAWQPGPCRAVLMDAGVRKINVTKITRELFGLGLKEAKDLVDSAPATLIDGISRENAQYIDSKYRSEGAKVAIDLSESRPDSSYSQMPSALPNTLISPAGIPREQPFLPGEFDVVLVAPGERRDEVVWLLRALVGRSYQAAQEATDKPQASIISGISESDAERIKKILENEGAVASIVSNAAPVDEQAAGQSQRIRRRSHLKEK